MLRRCRESAATAKNVFEPPTSGRKQPRRLWNAPLSSLLHQEQAPLFPAATVHFAIFFPHISTCPHISPLSGHTAPLQGNGRPCARLQRRARPNAPQQLKQDLKIRAQPNAQPLMLFVHRQRMRFHFSNFWQLRARLRCAHLFSRRRDAIHALRIRTPIPSAGDAALFSAARPCAQPQISCRAFLAYYLYL